MGFDYRPSGGLRETDSSLGGHKQNFAHTNTQRRGAVTPKETKPKPPASVGGPPVEVWVGRDSPQGRGHREVPLGVNPLAVCINPTIEPVHPRIGATQAEQLPGRECNPTNQQIIGLKLY